LTAQRAGGYETVDDHGKMKQDMVEELAALRERESFLHTVFDSIRDGISILNSDLVVIQTNQWIEERHHEDMPIVGKTCYEVYQKRHTPCPRCPSLRSFSTGQVEVEQMEVPSPDSSPFWIELSAYPIKDEAGHVTSVIEHVKEITEQKLAEEALRESEERFRDLVEHSFDLICTHDLQGRLLWVNAAAERITGYTTEELVGRSLRDLLAPEVRDQLDDYLAEIRREGEASGLMRVVDRSGERRIWEYHNSLRVEGVPAPIVRGTARDITRRKAMEEELRRQERLAAVGQLAAGIAHDFRNILATILLYAEMDLRMPHLPPRLADHLQIMIDESNRATDLVRQILDSSSRAMLRREPVDLSPFISQTLDVLRRTIPENVRISLEVEPGEGATPLTVLADTGRLQQILTNLALNARDAMPEGGELQFTLSRREIRGDETPPVATMDPGAWICLAVSDTGHGMTDEVQDHLFEPFFTTKEVDKGTGLGLAQVYGIIRQHKGTIDVQTAPGQGTTFRIYLPAHEEASEEEEAGDAAPSASLYGQGETILLVEDNHALRGAARSILESLGYQVLTAADGREALALCASPRESAERPAIDLVVTDLVMPHTGGEALMGQLTGRCGGPGSYPDLKAVGITGYAMEDLADELREVGFVDLVQKPFDAEGLARVVRRALD
jgi:PAS domain S-box-containing protein